MIKNYADLKPLLDRFCRNLEFSEKQTGVCKLLADRMIETFGSPPLLTVCGASLFVTASILDTGKSIEDVSNACGVSNTTILAAYNKVKPESWRFMPDEWIYAVGGYPNRLHAP